MRAFLLAALVVFSGCCSLKEYEDLREELADTKAALARQTEFTAGAHDDAAMLQSYAIELQVYIRQLESGAMWQAYEMARIVDTCEI